MLDYHGFYKPTGMNPIHINIVNIESVFGMEEMKWNEDNERYTPPMRIPSIYPYDVWLVDYTPGPCENASKTDYRPIYNAR